MILRGPFRHGVPLLSGPKFPVPSLMADHLQLRSPGWSCKCHDLVHEGGQEEEKKGGEATITIVHTAKLISWVPSSGVAIRLLRRRVLSQYP